MIDARAVEELSSRIDEGEQEARVIFARLRAYVSTLAAQCVGDIAPPVAVEPPPPPATAPVPEPVSLPEPVAETEQPSLFGAEELPVPESQEPVQSIYVHFERLEDIAAFGDAIGVQLGVNTRQITFPPDDMFRKTRPALAPIAEGPEA